VRAPKIQKPSVARVIVKAIRCGDPPGRFLRKDEKTGKWVDVGDKKAAEKTSQALREKTIDEREKLKTSPGGDASASVLLPTPTSLLYPGGMPAVPAAPVPGPIPLAAEAPVPPAVEVTHEGGGIKKEENDPDGDEHEMTTEEAAAEAAEVLKPESTSL
jgi:hypothetical protein